MSTIYWAHAKCASCGALLQVTRYPIKPASQATLTCGCPQRSTGVGYYTENCTSGYDEHEPVT